MSNQTTTQPDTEKALTYLYDLVTDLRMQKMNVPPVREITDERLSEFGTHYTTLQQAVKGK